MGLDKAQMLKHSLDASIKLKTPQCLPIHKDFTMFNSVTLKRIARDSVRLYFAPLVGAVRGARAEVASVLKDIQQRRGS